MPASLRSARSDTVLITTRLAATSARCRSRRRSTTKATRGLPRASRSPGAVEEDVQRHRGPAHECRREQSRGRPHAALVGRITAPHLAPDLVHTGIVAENAGRLRPGGAGYG